MKRSDQIKELIKKYDITAKIGFGQNFLLDDFVISKIEAAIFALANPCIAEIGCGLGSLTYGLVSHETEVIGYEIDRDMITVLKNEIKAPNFTLCEEDFMKADISLLAAKNALIVGNLPYNLTKRIIEKIIADPHPFSFGFMVQKEVAEKLMYVPGKKTNSPLGAYLFLNGTVNLVLDVPASSFQPSPKIASAFITYTAKSAFPSYYSKLKKMYMGENKVLAGYLQKSGYADKEKVAAILDNPSRRARELTEIELRNLIAVIK